MLRAGCSPHSDGHSVSSQLAATLLPQLRVHLTFILPALIRLCPSLWNQTLKVSRLFNMGWRPRAMEFALAVNYLYYVWSVWFYTLPKAVGLWMWWYMEMSYMAAVFIKTPKKDFTTKPELVFRVAYNTLIEIYFFTNNYNQQVDNNLVL